MVTAEASTYTQRRAIVAQELIEEHEELERLNTSVTHLNEAIEFLKAVNKGTYGVIGGHGTDTEILAHQQHDIAEASRKVQAAIATLKASQHDEVEILRIAETYKGKVISSTHERMVSSAKEHFATLKVEIPQLGTISADLDNSLHDTDIDKLRLTASEYAKLLNKIKDRISRSLQETLDIFGVNTRIRTGKETPQPSKSPLDLLLPWRWFR